MTAEYELSASGKEYLHAYLLTGSLTQKLLQGPIGIGIGLVFGYLYGMLLHYLPSRNAVSMAGTEKLQHLHEGCSKSEWLKGGGRQHFG